MLQPIKFIVGIYAGEGHRSNNFYLNHQIRVADNISTILVSLSIFSSVLLILSYLILWRKEPLIARRVSLRLTFASGCSDLIFLLFQLFLDVIPIGPSSCSGIIWAFMMFCLLSIFLNAMIALNLQLLLIHHCSMTPLLEVSYYIGPFIVALTTSIITASTQIMGWDDIHDTCWYIFENPSDSIIGSWFTYFAWVFLVVIYSVIVTTLIQYQQWRRRRRQRREILAMEPQSSEGIQVLRRQIQARLQYDHVINRVMLYPLVPLFSQVPTIVVMLVNYHTGTLVFPLYIISYIFISLQGVFFFFIYCLDPGAKTALSLTWHYTLSLTSWLIPSCCKWHRRHHPPSSATPSLSQQLSPIDSKDQTGSRSPIAPLSRWLRSIQRLVIPASPPLPQLPQPSSTHSATTSADQGSEVTQVEQLGQRRNTQRHQLLRQAHSPFYPGGQQWLERDADRELEDLRILSSRAVFGGMDIPTPMPPPATPTPEAGSTPETSLTPEGSPDQEYNPSPSPSSEPTTESPVTQEGMVYNVNPQDPSTFFLL
ncbi:MAG: hypothetical protein DHS80DRAFT_21834 [Piptocephalis tieghemiana]|nr:MAG: hypothetical protein DHS80DRAFT_21834 [Piptocephalis tieghemiana]